MIVSLVTFCLGWFSCTRSAAQLLTDSTLRGSWQWLRTDGGFGFHIHDTPESTGNTVILHLAADNTYAIQVNGVTSSQGTYTVEQKQCIHDQTMKRFIRFSDVEMSPLMVESLTDTRLSVSDEAFDGISSEYQLLQGFCGTK